VSSGTDKIKTVRGISDGAYYVWNAIIDADICCRIDRGELIVILSDNTGLVQPVKYSIHFDPSICRWCRSCELVCALVHGDTCSPSLSRIRVRVNTLDLEAKVDICMQCGVPRCMEACPVEGAMVVDHSTGARRIVESKCILCGKCAQACPLNARGTVLFRDPKVDRFVKCDLCGGKPSCVEYCPNGALTLASSEAK